MSSHPRYLPWDNRFPIQMLVAYSFEISFILVLYISQFIGLFTKGQKGNATSNCACPRITTHDCSGGDCRCSAVMIHSERCVTSHGRDQPATESRNLSLRERWSDFPRDAFEKHNRAMTQTTPSFLDTAIFFAISITIGIFATSNSPGFTRYESRILGYVALLATLPLHTVIAFSYSVLRRRALRQWLASLATLFLSIFTAAQMADSGNDRWGSICFGYSFKLWSRRTIATYIILSLVAFWSMFAPDMQRMISPIVHRVQRMIIGKSRRGDSLSQHPGLISKDWGYDQSRRYGKITVWVPATSTLIFAFFAGVCLIHDRQHMKGLAGKSYNESHMSYGQYLAAFIWLPVVVEYVYHIKCK